MANWKKLKSKFLPPDQPQGRFGPATAHPKIRSRRHQPQLQGGGHEPSAFTSSFVLSHKQVRARIGLL